MLRYELTPNNAGFILWGDSEALNELHELIHYIVDESPLIKVKDGFMLSLAYDIRKAREGNRRVEQHQYDQHDTYKLYGVELLWPLVLVTVLNTQKLNGLYSDRQKPAVCHVCL
nr:hypothetical protein [Klebsiella michiganensis]